MNSEGTAWSGNGRFAVSARGGIDRFLGDLKTGWRIVLLLVLPSLGLLWFAAATVAEEWRVHERAKDVRGTAVLVTSVSALVHEIQKERGLSAGLIGAKGGLFGDDLRTQRTETDGALSEFRRSVAAFRVKQPDAALAEYIEKNILSLGRISDIRQRVDRLAIDEFAAIGAYIDIIDILLTIARRLAISGHDPRITGVIVAYLDLVEGKERAGQERAVGSVGLAAGAFPPALHARFVELGAKQRDHFNAFRSNVGRSIATALDEIEESLPARDVRRMREAIIDGAVVGGNGAGIWFRAATARIDLLRQLEDRVVVALNKVAGEAMDAAKWSLVLTVMLALALLAATAGAAAAVLGNVTRPISRLADTMERLARGDERVEIEGTDRRDEIGVMSRALEVFKESEVRVRLLAQAIEQTPAGVVITDTGGTIAYVNPAVMRLSGRTWDELIGANPRVFASGKTSREQYEKLWRAIGAGHVWNGEILNRRKDGAFVWEHEVIAPMRDSRGEVTHYIGIKEDITARKKLEEHLESARLAAEEANRSKSFFLANMSHELRTPLNAILGFSEAVKLGIPTPLTHPKHVEYIGLVHQSAGYLLQLINEILDLSRIESGVQAPEEASVRLPDVLETCIRMVHERADRKKIRLEVEIGADCPCLTADERMIKQIILNLLTNAIKFTPDGGKVSIRAALDEGDLAVRVADNGVGVKPEDMARIFTPFARAENDPYVRHQEGTGLGLVLSRRMAELHGGSLDLDSAPGQGTTVTVRFPRSRLAPEADLA